MKSIVTSSRTFNIVDIELLTDLKIVRFQNVRYSDITDVEVHHLW